MYFIVNIFIARFVSIFQDIEVPDEFSKNLVYWVEDNMATFNRRPARRDEGSVCYPSGCVDPGDIGQVCCPF